jgi:hypothetical protein
MDVAMVWTSCKISPSVHACRDDQNNRGNQVGQAERTPAARMTTSLILILSAGGSFLVGGQCQD